MSFLQKSLTTFFPGWGSNPPAEETKFGGGTEIRGGCAGGGALFRLARISKKFKFSPLPNLVLPPILVLPTDFGPPGKFCFLRRKNPPSSTGQNFQHNFHKNRGILLAVGVTPPSSFPTTLIAKNHTVFDHPGYPFDN